MLRIANAIVRPPSATFADGLTTADLGRPDLGLARDQHAAYCAALEDLGVALTHLPPDDAFPDSTFVEDTAVVAPRGVVITRPGAPPPGGATAAVAQALRRPAAPTRALPGNGTVDGGDVCLVGGRYLIGRSGRADDVGARALVDALGGRGSDAAVVDVPAGRLLHLKSGLSGLGGDRVLVDASLVDRPVLAALERITVDPDEAYAANCIALNDAVVLPDGFPLTRRRLEAAGLDVRVVGVSEFRKMDGGVSCLSIRLPAG
ncbi:MAG: dimethylarginine dimethylaminohydrolase family protein, partial [Actinomycetota bacterium]